MSTTPLFQKIDAVTIPVPDLDEGLRFYRDSLGPQLRWRNDDIGQAGLALAASDTEIVLALVFRALACPPVSVRARMDRWQVTLVTG